jgi:hypothetical protein
METHRRTTEPKDKPVNALADELETAIAGRLVMDEEKGEAGFTRLRLEAEGGGKAFLIRASQNLERDSFEAVRLEIRRKQETVAIIDGAPGIGSEYVTALVAEDATRETGLSGAIRERSAERIAEIAMKCLKPCERSTAIATPRIFSLAYERLTNAMRDVNCLVRNTDISILINCAWPPFEEPEWLLDPKFVKRDPRKPLVDAFAPRFAGITSMTSERTHLRLDSKRLYEFIEPLFSKKDPSSAHERLHALSILREIAGQARGNPISSHPAWRKACADE